MTNKKCGTCEYFVPLASGEPPVIGQPVVGSCHRNPPVVIPTPHGPGTAMPAVNDQHWCGEYKAAILARA